MFSCPCAAHVTDTEKPSPPQAKHSQAVVGCLLTCLRCSLLKFDVTEPAWNSHIKTSLQLQPQGQGAYLDITFTTNLSFFCCEAATRVNSGRKQEAGHRDVAVPKNSVLDVSCACGCMSGTIWTRTAADSSSGWFICATVEHLRMWGVPYICDVWFVWIHKHKIWI